MRKVFVVGVGMTRFLQPFTHHRDYVEMGKQAVYRAIRDIDIDYELIHEAAVGYVYGDSCSGQRVLYELGQSGIPIYNINNRECSGSSALYLSYRSIAAGFSEYCLALGFDKTPPKDQKNDDDRIFKDRADPIKHWKREGNEGIYVYARAAEEYMRKYGDIDKSLVKIAEKNYRFAAGNPYYTGVKKPFNAKEILDSPKISGSLTKLQMAAPSDGAAAVLICSEQFMLANKLEHQAIEILGLNFLTNEANDINSNSAISLSGYNLTQKTAQSLYAQAKLSPQDFDLCELQDTTTVNELLAYEALGFCSQGGSSKFIEQKLNSVSKANDASLSGSMLINPSGGVLGRGNCMGANGIAQCVEICWQLRGMAGDRQIKGPRMGLQHSLGLGAGCLMGAYRKVNAEKGWKRENQTSDPEELERIEGKEYEVFRRNNERETCPKK